MSKQTKYRIFELSKEFKKDSKVIIDVLRRNKIKVVNNFSAIGEDEYQILKSAFAPKMPSKKAETQSQPQQSTQQQTQQTQQTAQPKVETKPVEKVEAKPAEKVESKVETKTEPKPEAKSDSQQQNQNRSGQKFQRRQFDQKPRFNQRSEQRSDQRSENRSDERIEERSERQERSDRSERNDRSDRSDRSERSDRRGQNQNSSRNQYQRRDRRGSKPNSRSGDQAAEQNRQLQHRSPSSKRRGKNQPAPVQKVEIARPKHIRLGETIAVKDLASKMSYTAAEVIKKLLMMGVMANINQEIDFDTATIVANEFGVTTEALPPEVDPTLIPEIVDDPKTLKTRPPVVTVMGHVDHGKTSLLDVIRRASVASHEAGGITQHIGAYQTVCRDRKITFLDTPGHEAFTAMRARGAQVTDIAILVVAADDGVMPQTVEAIHHAQSAHVPIIVAINKIDKPGANPERVKQELMEHGLVSDAYGGDTVMVEVSAKKNIGINELLEMVLLVADMQELKANPNREARGVIIEAKLDKGRGTVATVLVQSGTLRIGDSILAGTAYGKVRAMNNDRGEPVKKAGPSVPVEVLGLNDVPAAGDFLAALDEKTAKSIAESRIERTRTQLIRSKKVSLDDLFQQIQEGEIKDLNIVVKADVQGSVEALQSSLMALNKNDEVRVSIVHSGVGAVNESDVMLASASNALILAFNVRPDNNARKLADTEHIDIRTYRVIYDAINDVKDAMSGMLAPKFKEVVLGHVEIRKVMKFSKALVAGSYVIDGKITNNAKIRIVRDHIEIFDGQIDSLRRFKDEVKEVSAGYECGISIVDFRDFKEGDIIEPYVMEEIKTSLADVNHE